VEDFEGQNAEFPAQNS
jgi:hypothetical protein